MQNKKPEIIFQDGWYPEEEEGGHSFRWMGKASSLLVKASSISGKKYIRITAGHSFEEGKFPRLEVFANKVKIGESEIEKPFSDYAFPLEDKGDVNIEFRLDRVFTVPDDTRELGIMVRKIEIVTSQDVFIDGWYPWESSKDSTPYRWMKEKALILLDAGKPGKKFLRLKACFPLERQDFPSLEVFSEGKKIGEKKITRVMDDYAFPFEEGGEVEIELRLNKISLDPHDQRKLGIQVSEVKIVSGIEDDVFLEGWYPWEGTSSQAPYRWTRQEASCFFSGLPEARTKYLKIRAGHSFYRDKNPILTVLVDSDEKRTEEILSGDKTYFIPLGNTPGCFELKLKMDKVFSSEKGGEKRDLGIQVKSLEILSPESREFLYGDGWYGMEHDELFHFRWMKRKGQVFLPPDEIQRNSYISLYACSEFADCSQKLTVSLGGKTIAEIPLLFKWNFYSIKLQPIKEEPMEGEKAKHIQESENELVLKLNKLFPEKYHQGDKRELGARITPVEFHNDKSRHEAFVNFHKNAILNLKEMREGKETLSSHPLYLGVDLYSKCNMKPPCVYCLWDRMKNQEGEYSDVVVDDKTLESYGPFFSSARIIVNCSFGEPLLHPKFKEILDFVEKSDKFLEISTNGQAFTPRTISALVGKKIYLYVSLDAASKETYEKIRNNRWDSIVSSLVLLNQERKKKGNLPKIYMVFMPMKVNRNDLEDFFRLCQKIEADSLVLRPLNYLENPRIERDRGGYHFDYEKELLSREEIEEIIEKCDQYSEKYGIPVANQFTFGTIQKPQLKKKKGVLVEPQHF